MLCVRFLRIFLAPLETALHRPALSSRSLIPAAIISTNTLVTGRTIRKVRQQDFSCHRISIKYKHEQEFTLREERRYFYYSSSVCRGHFLFHKANCEPVGEGASLRVRVSHICSYAETCMWSAGYTHGQR